MNAIQCVSLQDAANIATVVGSLVGLIGVPILIYQFRKQKQTQNADFFLKLFAEFRSYEKLFTVAHDWENGKTEFDFKKDKGLIVAYFGFFESLFHFVNKGVLTMEMIDDSFSFSFFSLVCNPQVQEKELIKCYKDYRNIYQLYEKWKQFHEAQGKEVLTELQIKQGLVYLHMIKEYKLVIK